MTLDGLRRLRSADFKYEDELGYHVVEPLLRLADLEKEARIQRCYDIGAATADYAVFDGGDVRCIIETKRRIALGKGNDWRLRVACGAREQARTYAKNVRAPAFVLIDFDRVFCFRTCDQLPCLTIDRNALDNSALNALRDHILGPRNAAASSRSRAQPRARRE